MAAMQGHSHRNEIVVRHDPKTFETERVNGTLRFKSYDGKSVTSCGQLSEAECYNITVGRFHNDVWTYPLRCARAWDSGCMDASWSELEGGAPLGGCTLINNREVCSHPQERHGHVSAVFPDGRLLVYGGFSRLCEDYCSDVWSLDLRACLSDRLPATPHPDNPALASAHARACKWRLIERLERTSPGRRWRVASSQAGSDWFLFGGHRLWHGFSPTNSLANLWLNRDKFDFGGLFDDLWVLRYNGSDASVATPAAGGSGGFVQVLPRESCYAVPPTLVFRDRHDVVCTVHWPTPRAQAALAAVPQYNGSAGVVSSVHLYLHGGYTVPFPYPHALGPGAGPGVGTLASDGPRPYPTHPYFLADLWRYDSATGLWALLKPTGVGGDSGAASIPGPRFGHTLTLAGSVLFLFGGRSTSDILGESWMYNLRSARWVRKATHVHPIYPAQCTSDVTPVALPNANIPDWTVLAARDARPTAWFPGDDGQTGVTAWEASTLMFGSAPSEAQLEDGTATPPRNVTVEVVNAMSVVSEPTRGTLLDGIDGRWTDPILIAQPRRQAPGWDGCRDRADGRTDLPAELQWVQPSQRFAHAAVYSASAGALFVYGGEAFVQEQVASDSATYASANVADLWYFNVQHCANNCSFNGACDYGHCRCDDGWYGLDCSNATCPGDYCHYDGDTFTSSCVHCASVPHVHYLRRYLADPAVNHPLAHQLVFKDLIVAAGGWQDALLDPQGDVFQHFARKGVVNFTSLAVSDARTRGLFDGSYDTYADGTRWLRSLTAALEAASRLSHGVCNGFGQCLCAPPFLGDDCSVKGCRENCFGRGVCVVEYPVARCDCDPPFGGPDCSLVVCPNNCSFPNGACQDDGSCACGWMLNPYNRTQNFTQFGGPDCSFVQPFAAGESARLGALFGSPGGAAAVLALVLAACLMLLVG